LSDAPPRAGKGSGQKEWFAFARRVGLEVDEGMSRAHLIGLVESGGADPSWHPTAQRWYRSLRFSGQSQFFQASDWEAARYVAEAMTINLRSDRFSAEQFKGIWSAMGDLLTTEAARRRVRMEVEQADDGDDETPAEVIRLADYAKDLVAAAAT
jgi:hypothetical protein